MTRKERIEARLTDRFQPTHLEVIDESMLHHGHQPGMDGTGETHMRIVIAAAELSGLSRVARHRAVNEAIAVEFDTGLHALAIDVR